jgi:mannose-6-phosphate isomerase-like protein (cupin superfamily)
MLALLLAATLAGEGAATPHRPAVFVQRQEVMRAEPAPHGGPGTSTAYRYSDKAPGRTFEFRERILHPGGSAIGVHPIDFDEVYYILEGHGVVTADDVVRSVGPGDLVYFYRGSQVGIRQTGKAPLRLIVAYPLPQADKAASAAPR